MDPTAALDVIARADAELPDFNDPQRRPCIFR